MRTKTLEESFIEFHEKNPAVFDLFRHYAEEIRNSGRDMYSAHTILHRIRWHTDVSTGSNEGFKINNNHSKYLAEMLEKTDQSFVGFFSHREG